MKTVTLNVDDEIAALGDLVVLEIADIKAKKGVATYLTDAIPAVITMAGNYQKIGADLKSPDDIAYLVKCIAGALIPVAAPVA